MTDTQQPSVTTLVVQRKQDVQNLQPELQRMLPPSIPADKFVRTVQTAITLNPDIAQCDKQSVLAACMKAASDGLILDGREAVLNVFNVKVKKGGQEVWEKRAQYMPMVTGVIKRVRNSGEVARLNAFVVHANDEFEVTYGLDMSLKHRPNFADPGHPIGAYAICRFKDGLDDFEFMTRAEIEDIRGRSKSKDKGPWVTDWKEMAKKTVIRRLSKRLPMDSDLRNVVQRIDEDYEFEQPKNDTPQVDPETGEVTGPAAAAPAKKRGGAASKLNPQPAEPPAPEPREEPAAVVTEAQYEDVDADADGAGDDDII